MESVATMDYYIKRVAFTDWDEGLQISEVTIITTV